MRKLKPVTVAIVIAAIALVVVGCMWLCPPQSPAQPVSPATSTSPTPLPATTKSEALQNCLRAASESDASAAVIEAAKQACHEQYK